MSDRPYSDPSLFDVDPPAPARRQIPIRAGITVIPDYYRTSPDEVGVWVGDRLLTRSWRYWSWAVTSPSHCRWCGGHKMAHLPGYEPRHLPGCPHPDDH